MHGSFTIQTTYILSTWKKLLSVSLRVSFGGVSRVCGIWPIAVSLHNCCESLVCIAANRLYSFLVHVGLFVTDSGVLRISSLLFVDKVDLLVS